MLETILMDFQGINQQPKIRKTKTYDSWEHKLQEISSMSLEYVAPVELLLKYTSSYMSFKTFKNLPDCSIHLNLRFNLVVLLNGVVIFINFK